jgi:hypothetical protein
MKPGAAADLAHAKAPAASGARARRRRWEPWVFAGLAAIHLVPIWLLAYVPTQDGPAHLENAVALLRRAHVPVLAEYYELNLRLLPNWLGHGVLAALAVPFTPPLAEKILFSLYVVGLPLAFRYALPRRARERGFGAAIFPFVYGLNFYMGFTGFCLGVMLQFLALGIWMRSRGRLRPGRAVALIAVTSLMAAAHPVPVVAFIVIVSAMVAWHAGRSALRARTPGRRARVVRAHVGIALSMALAMLPAAAFVVALGAGGLGGETASWLPLERRVFALGVLLSLVSMGREDVYLTGAVAASVAAATIAAAWTRRRAGPGSAWLVAAGAAAALALLAPDAIGKGWGITLRLQIFPFALAIAWVGSGRSLPRVGRALPAVASALSVALLVLHWPTSVRLSRSLEEYVSLAPHVEPGRTLLPLVLTAGRDVDRARLVPLNFAPFLHAAGYVAATRDAVDLANYEANTSLFPLRFRPERNPFVALGRGTGLEGEGAPPCVDLDAGREAVRVDYVLLWGPIERVLGDACVRSWAQQLLRGYERVHVSRPNGYAQLWRRRPGS